MTHNLFKLKRGYSDVKKRFRSSNTFDVEHAIRLENVLAAAQKFTQYYTENEHQISKFVAKVKAHMSEILPSKLEGYVPENQPKITYSNLKKSDNATALSEGETKPAKKKARFAEDEVAAVKPAIHPDGYDRTPLDQSKDMTKENLLERKSAAKKY